MSDFTKLFKESYFMNDHIICLLLVLFQAVMSCMGMKTPYFTGRSFSCSVFFNISVSLRIWSWCPLLKVSELRRNRELKLRIEI